MKLLAGINYDPSTRAQKATSSLLAMTALDTTNLRNTFVAPSSGKVLVTLAGALRGATTSPQIYLGVLDGATIKGRVIPIQGRGSGSSSANNLYTCSASFVVTGLTGGTTCNWDAAYGVEQVVASSNLEYGGPNNSTSNDAAGGFQYMIWDASACLASIVYDPGSAVQSASMASALAMTALDTTNLRNTFVCPNNGPANQCSVMVRARMCATAATLANTSFLIGVLDGATVRCRQPGMGGMVEIGTSAAGDRDVQQAQMLVTGLTAGTTYTWDLAYGVELAGASMVVSYGGPDDTTTNNAFGAITYEVWNPVDIPGSLGTFI